jgi:hypothetical protein
MTQIPIKLIADIDALETFRSILGPNLMFQWDTHTSLVPLGDAGGVFGAEPVRFAYLQDVIAGWQLFNGAITPCTLAGNHIQTGTGLGMAQALQLHGPGASTFPYMMLVGALFDTGGSRFAVLGDDDDSDMLSMLLDSGNLATGVNGSSVVATGFSSGTQAIYESWIDSVNAYISVNGSDASTPFGGAIAENVTRVGIGNQPNGGIGDTGVDLQLFLVCANVPTPDQRVAIRALATAQFL